MMILLIRFEKRGIEIMKKWLEIKRKIALSGIDRREIADQMGMTYQKLSQRINGFYPWSDEELSNLEEVLAGDPITADNP